MSESQEISRQRLADFLAARLRARARANSDAPASPNEPKSIKAAGTRPDDTTKPVTDS